ncbi:MAG: YDG domain-containing protein, partial [Enterococcus sp.]
SKPNEKTVLRNGEGNTPENPIIISKYTSRTEAGKYYKLIAGGYIDTLTAGSTIVEMTGGRIRIATGGMITQMSGGLIGKLSTVTIISLTGGLISTMTGGQINSMSGGTIVSMTSGSVNKLTDGFIYSSGGTIPMITGTAIAIKRSEIEERLEKVSMNYSIFYNGQPQNPFDQLPAGWANYVTFYYQKDSEIASTTPPTNVGEYKISAKYHHPGIPFEGVPVYNDTIDNEDVLKLRPKQMKEIDWDSSDKVYDGTNLTCTGIPKDIVSGEDISVRFKKSVKNAGNYTFRIVKSEIDLLGADRDNYEIETNMVYDVNRKIVPRKINVSGVRVEDKVYNGNTNAILPVQSALTFENTLPSEPLELDFSRAKAVFSDENVGTDKEVTITDVKPMSSSPNFMADNYALSINSVKGTITQKTVTITGIRAINRQLNDSLIVQLDDKNAQLTGVIEADREEISYTLGQGRLADKNIGRNKAVVTAIRLTGKKAENYQLVQPTDITVDILKQQSEATVHYSGGTQKIRKVNQGAKTYPRAGDEDSMFAMAVGFSLVGVVFVYLKKRKS